jgi:hypothetical protein
MSWLFGQSFNDDLSQFSDYNRSGGGYGNQLNWLSNIGKMPGIPDYLRGSPEGNWFEQLSGAAGGVRPGMTREAQKRWADQYGNIMAQAPNEQMAALGGNLFNPSFREAMPGYAAAMGSYARAPRVKGGLVSNPWYTT